MKATTHEERIQRLEKLLVIVWDRTEALRLQLPDDAKRDGKRALVKEDRTATPRPPRD